MPAIPCCSAVRVLACLEDVAIAARAEGKVPRDGPPSGIRVLDSQRRVVGKRAYR